MSEEMEQIVFTSAEGEETAFFVVEQTRIAGINYLLVADSEEDEAEAMILKEMESEEEDVEAVYCVVEDETEMNAISKVFMEMLDDIDIEMDNE